MLSRKLEIHWAPGQREGRGSWCGGLAGGVMLGLGEPRQQAPRPLEYSDGRSRHT